MRIGVLLRGEGDAARCAAYEKLAPELGMEVHTVCPERAGDPLLQAALCYRMLQLDYDAVVVYPENGSNLSGRIRGAVVHRTVLDVGPGTDPGLLDGVPGYRPLCIEGAPTPAEEVRLVLNALSA